MNTLRERAEKLEAEGIFLGGAAKFFETAGRKMLITLLNEGLTPSSKVLDVGCGCLRCGYWLIHILDQGCYFGIEPNAKMLDAGLRLLLEPGLAELKKPSFDHNADFDFTVFQQAFDVFVARSVWTHAAKPQIQKMLDGFLSTASPRGLFLTSYVRPSLIRRDYQGTGWIGRSHESDVPGTVRHKRSWIRAECAKRHLDVKEIKGKAYNFSNQTWLCIKRKPSAL